MVLGDFWQIIGDNRDKACDCLDHHRLLIDHPLWEMPEGDKPNGGWTTRIVTAAANVRSGMKVLLGDLAYCENQNRGERRGVGRSNGSEHGYVPWSAWTPAEVSTEHYVGKIYSISVSTDHTYIADGIVTHNSFRFGQTVADVANAVLGTLDEPTDLVMSGLPSIPTRVCHVAEPRCFLFRTNAGAIGRLMAYVS